MGREIQGWPFGGANGILGAMSISIPFAPRGEREAVERGTALAPRFDAAGLVPAVATDADTGEVLMLAYMNADALARSIATGQAHYWSRSRQGLWRKGETSGHVQEIVEIRVDCDQDTVWLKVRQAGAACHVGYRSCFYRRIVSAPDGGVCLELTEGEADDAE